MSFINSNKEEKNKAKVNSKENNLINSQKDLDVNSQKKLQVNYENANFISRLLFNWSKYAIKISNSRGLEISDICDVQKNQSTKYNATPLKSNWIYYSKKIKKYPLIFTILSVYYKIIAILTILDFISMLLDYVGIYIFKQLIMCFSKGNFFSWKEKLF